MQIHLHNLGDMKHDCQIDRAFKTVGLRCTTDRHDLFAYFYEDRCWSASQLSQKHPQVDLSTIYRNIQKFLDAGLIRSVHVHDQEEYFERIPVDHHDHQACPKCRALVCIPCPVANLTQIHTLEIEAVCSHCV